jgi:hypothetical protein
MTAKIPRNLEKSENGFHFYSIPSLSLPSGERGRRKRYELKMQPIFNPLSNSSKDSKTS